MQRVFLAAVLNCVLWGQTANAQLLVADPYAGDPKSSLSQWPVLYKLPPSHTLWYYQMGFCGLAGKGADYQAWYDRHSKFNVNALPETTWEGRVKKTADGLVEGVDEQGKSALMIINPSRAVSDIHIMGAAESKMLKLGKWVRFVGKVSAEGRVSEPVTQLEFYTPGSSDDLPLITPDAQLLIAGRLVRRIGEDWELRPARKCKLNGITFSLASNRRLTVDVAELDVAREGQKLTVRGRLFDPAAQTAMQVVQQGPGYFQDPFGVAEAEQARLAAAAAAKAANGETSLVPMIFTCNMVILTSSDDFDAAGKRKPAAPSQSQASSLQP